LKKKLNKKEEKMKLPKQKSGPFHISFLPFFFLSFSNSYIYLFIFNNFKDILEIKKQKCLIGHAVLIQGISMSFFKSLNM
jgi:hypothetical protein